MLLRSHFRPALLDLITRLLTGQTFFFFLVGVGKLMGNLIMASGCFGLHCHSFPALCLWHFVKGTQECRKTQLTVRLVCSL